MKLKLIDAVDHLVDNAPMGCVNFNDTIHHNSFSTYHVMTVVSGGDSTVETFMGRLRMCMLGSAYWAEHHRGGLDVYHIPNGDIDRVSEWFMLVEPLGEHLLVDDDFFYNDPTLPVISVRSVSHRYVENDGQAVEARLGEYLDDLLEEFGDEVIDHVLGSGGVAASRKRLRSVLHLDRVEELGSSPSLEEVEHLLDLSSCDSTGANANSNGGVDGDG